MISLNLHGLKLHLSESNSELAPFELEFGFL